MSGHAASASHGSPMRRVPHAKSHPVIKPLLNQLSSSIAGQLRRVDRAHASLQCKLDQNVSNMHEQIWKLKSSANADDLSNWHSKEDLRTYLTAMSLVGSSKNGGGGGRTFGEKHSFFDNIAKFKETMEAARTKKKERFRDKIRDMNIKPGTKKAAFLWQQMNLRDGSNDAMESTEAAAATAKDSAGATGVTSAAGSAGRVRSGSDREEEKESSDASDDAEPTAEEQDALRAAALAPDEPAAANAAAVDSAAMAHLALQRLNAKSHHNRNVSTALSLGGGHDANSSSPYGVPVPGRTPSQPISAPKQHRKAEWEIEEEAEERAEAAIAEALRKVEEEKKRKEDEEREAKRHKERDSLRPSSGAPPTATHASTAVSRRNSLLGSLAVAKPATAAGSVIPSAAATPQFSRRASVIGAASSLKVLAGSRAPRALQILPDKPALVASAALRSGDLSDDLVAEEASRVMGLMFANPNMLVHAAEAARRAQADQATERLGGAAVGIALSVPPGGGNSASDSRAGSALPARSRLQALTHQEEIERWNAATPVSARSVSHDVVDLAHKGILSLAAEKLGVHSMDSLGGGGGHKPAEFRPAPNAKASSTAAYLASFEARASPALRDAAAKRLADKSSSRPASASTTPRPKKPLTNFGHSPTSATTNVHSIAAPIEFRDARGRKELVTLGATTDPADVFAAIDQDLGSTLMSFEQLHVTNRAMAEEAKKRAEQAASDALAQEEVVQRKADHDAKEIDPQDVHRAKLAAKSRARGWVHTDGSPAKTLQHSGSKGHLSQKAAAAIAAADAAITASPTRKAANQRVSIDTSSNSVAPAAETATSPQAATAAASKPHLLSPSGRDYVHLSPLLIVPQWQDVARHTAYQTLVPGYVAPLPPPPPAAVKEEVQYDADGFPIKSANASAAAPLSPASFAFAPLSPKAAPATDPASKRRELDARLNAELDAENWEGSSTARRKELQRRRRIANEPSPIASGPSVFQQQKSALLKASYVKFVRSTADAHRIQGAIGAQRVEDISGRKSRQAQQQHSTQDASAPTSPQSPLRSTAAPSIAGSLTPTSPMPDSSQPTSPRQE